MKRSELTRMKIIRAAGELFANFGYHRVTVRDIVQKAKTHLSALNYHFQSKESLYRTVLRYAYRSPEVEKLDIQSLQSLPEKDALFQILRAVVHDYGQEDVRGWGYKLIDRECLEPSPAFEEIAAAKLRPEFEYLSELLGRAVGKPSTSKEIRFVVLGLYGQISMFTLYRPFIRAVAEGAWDEFHREEWLARALTQATLAAARADLSEIAP